MNPDTTSTMDCRNESRILADDQQLLSFANTRVQADFMCRSKIYLGQANFKCSIEISFWLGTRSAADYGS